MSNKIRVTFTDLTGTRHADVTLRSSLTADQVIYRLKQSGFLHELEPGQVFTLQIKRTLTVIQPNQTFENAGVEDGDIITAGAMTRGGGIETALPDEIAKQQIKILRRKLDSGEQIAGRDLDALEQQISLVESYLRPSDLLILPDTTDMDELEEEIKHGKQLLIVLNRRRRSLEEQLAADADPSSNFRLRKQLDETKESIASIEQQLLTLESRTQRLEGVQSQNDGNVKIIDQDFSPDWSVVKSQVTYVDAQLAYQYADSTEDVNILLGFTTLFLGAALSFVASIIAAETAIQITLFGTSVAFSILLTIIFGVLTIRARKQNNASKKRLFSDETNIDG